MDRKSEIVLDGLEFTEAPRWHRGAVWFVDMFQRRVYRWDGRGGASCVVEFPDDDPSGLGFLPDGTVLCVLMRHRTVVALGDAGQTPHADLSPIGGTYLNDMVVDGTGRAYIDSIVRDGLDDTMAAGDRIVIVERGRPPRVASSELGRPNGLAVTADGRTLIVAQPPLHRIAKVDIGDDGALRSPTVLFDTQGGGPDGLCVDAEDGVWFGGMRSNAFIRIDRSGRVTDRISVAPRLAVACVLGGGDRRTLYMATSDATVKQLHARKPMLTMPASVETIRLANESLAAVGHPHAWIEAAPVDVPGAGWP